MATAALVLLVAHPGSGAGMTKIPTRITKNATSNPILWVLVAWYSYKMHFRSSHPFLEEWGLLVLSYPSVFLTKEGSRIQ
jgi:hypothetical protein